jgi:hypothetical protein
MAATDFPAWAKWFCAAIGFIAACAWFGLAAEHLFLGWLYFPVRVLPQVTIDVPAVLVGALSLAAFVVGVHFTARWWQRATAQPDGPRPWSWRSSLALSMLILLLFAAGTAMVGATHQLVWLIQGRADGPPAQSEPVLGMLEAVRESSRKKSVAMELRHLAIGVANFEDTNATLPPGGTMTADGKLMHGWASYLMPYASYAADLDYSVPWNEPPNARVFQCNLSMFVNPSLPGPYFDPDGFGYAHIAGNEHVLRLGKIEVETSQRQDGPGESLQLLRQQGALLSRSGIGDGATNTLLFGTVAENFKPWGHPANVRDPSSGIGRSSDGFAGPPAWGGAEFVMCDGSVRFLSNKTDPRVAQQLATPASGDNH